MNAVVPPPVTLRPTEERDLDAVVEILRSTVEWYRPFTDPEDLAASHEVDATWARANLRKREFWSAVLHGEVVGVLTLQDAGDFLYLGYVYVHRDHVGKRIGRRLLDHASAEVVRRDKEGMVLIAHPDAEWAVRAYTRYGFECVAESDDEVCAWNDGWLEPYHESGFQLWKWMPEA
ncbi:MAG: GNAT family N-acetyltransferase [Alphaproteobacteria bacterium]|nr:GNAT family N-acetyltransferase [Alphaproteobacteria bacterium]